MRKCKKCQVQYNGHLNRCPLCKSELVGKMTPNVFPKIKSPKNKLITKILLYISFCASLLCSFIEYTITQSLTASKYVILGLITNYLMVNFIIKNYKNVIKMLNKYFWLLLFIFFVWYFVTKSLIITTYFIPILCIIIFAFNSIVMLVLRNDYILKFGKTILLDCIIGLIPLALVAFHLTTFSLLSYICAILDLLVFVGLLIFCKDNILEELQKIFNF